MDASFDDRKSEKAFAYRGDRPIWTNDQRESYRRARDESHKALEEALTGDLLLHGSDCRCAECCEKRKSLHSAKSGVL